MGKSNMAMVMLVVLVLIAAVGVGYFIYSGQTQQTAIEKQTETINSGSSLTGKPATANVRAVDPSNDNTQVAAHLYLVKDPVVGDESITGGFSADGTAMSTSTRTQVTEGLNVGDKIVALASNATYFGFPTEVMELTGSQSKLVDVEVYSTTDQLDIIIEDKDENALGRSGATRNLTLGSEETEVLAKVYFQVNTTNKAFNLAGFYFDKSTTADSNISSIDKAAGYSGSQAFSKASLNLERTEADDTVFLLDKPKLLLEWDSVTIANGIEFSADGNKANAPETIVLYVLDKVWIKSSVDNNKLIYAYETDGSTHSDVGMTDPSFSFIAA